MQVYVEINGSTVAIECEPTDLVEDVKAKIATEASVAADKLKLYAESTLMEDGTTLQDYSIVNESTITCEVEADPVTEPGAGEPAVTEPSGTKLADLVTIYDGDILYSVREMVTDGEETKEKIIISFKNGEHEALKDELLAREIEKIRVEVNVTKMDVKTKYNAVLAIILKGAEEQSGGEQTA